jgi:hypothetical protein
MCHFCATLFDLKKIIMITASKQLNQHFLKDTRRLKTPGGRQNHSGFEVKLLRQIGHNRAKT